MAREICSRAKPSPVVTYWQPIPGLSEDPLRDLNEEESQMSEEKDKAIEKDQQTILPTGDKPDELSEKDLDKASGGLKYQKWIDINQKI